MQVTVIGPNLSSADQRKGQFHVHKAGCKDITRSASYRQAAPHMDFDAASVEAVAEFVYEDQLAENAGTGEWDTADAYLGEFHFAPCTNDLKNRKDTTMTTKTTKPLTRKQKQAAFEAAIPARTAVDLPDDTKIDITTIQKIAGPRYEVVASKAKGASYVIVKREGKTVAYASET
jgi:hypothetical protein